ILASGAAFKPVWPFLTAFSCARNLVSDNAIGSSSELIDTPESGEETAMGSSFSGLSSAPQGFTACMLTYHPSYVMLSTAVLRSNYCNCIHRANPDTRKCTAEQY